jgi:hypothetical protein
VSAITPVTTLGKQVTEGFHSFDVENPCEIGADNDIPHLSTALIDKYVTDLQHMALLSKHG